MKLSRTLIFFIVIFSAGCSGRFSGSTLMPYSPEEGISVAEAAELVEELLLTQNSRWRPDEIEVAPRYIALGYGETTKTKGVALVGNGVIAGGSTARTRAIGERFYFRSIESFRLISWRRDWYVVSLMGEGNALKKHIFYTHSIDDAKKMINALAALKKQAIN